MAFCGRSSAVIAAALVLFVSACSSGPADDGVPESVVRQNTLGTSYLGQQEWVLAADALRGALAERPDDPLLLTNLAVALIQDGQPEAAEVELRKALTNDPDHPQANYNLGLVESNRGNFEAAATHFQAVTAFDDQDVLTWYNLGTSYASLERGDDAIAALRRALAIDPDHVSSLYALGRALVASGARDEGRELITRSQEIRARSGLDTAVGSQYGEQGFYALGIDYPGDALAAPDAIDVRFSVAQEASSDAPAVVTVARTSGQPAVVMGDGAALSLVSTTGVLSLPPHPSGARVVALAAGDGDSDEADELYALLAADEAPGSVAVMEPSDDGGYAWAASELVGGADIVPAGVTVASLLLVDREHDGDLDLLMCWSPSAASSCGVATNDGSGAMTVAPSLDHGFDVQLGDVDAIRLSLTDFDNDRDIDLVVAEPGGIHVLSNQRDGTFAAVGNEVGLGDGAAGAADSLLIDLNKDGWMDVVTAGANGLDLYVNERGRFAAAVNLAGHTEATDRVLILDADNDGFLDVAAGSDSGAIAYRNGGAGQWQARAEWFADISGAPVHAFDADGDGDLDLVTAAAAGVALVENEGGDQNRWISVESRGVGDNTYGVGAKVEVLAGALRQKFEVTSSLPVHAGLGDRDQVDSIRHLWPSGVLQDEIRQSAGTRPSITQLDRKGTSCPILYVWRDDSWQFVTDFMGGSAIGYQLAEGVFNTPDTDEYIKLEQSPAVAADGTIRLRVNNQLQEIIWFDQLQLIAVDHPKGTELFPNERLMPAPPWPAHELFVSEDIRPIASAKGLEDEKDWSEQLERADGVYVENFTHLRFKGYADMHTIELDLGEFPADERVVLLLNGWIDYADSTANVAASQAGIALTPPVLTISDGDGGWSDTGHLMGFPAGLPKTMAVDLTGLFASDDHRIRIRTNMRIYWDQARILVGGADLPVTTHRLSPVSAELGYGGFPLELGSDRRTPKSYDPRIVSNVSPWKAHLGRYTEFGDVKELVSRIDDRLVTTRSGDEIELSFQSPGPVPEGSTRTYLMFADGFGKDMDINSAASSEVGPMPFHGMPSYPYPASVVPPVDLSDTLGRPVTDEGRGAPGALPQVFAPQRGTQPSAPSSGRP